MIANHWKSLYQNIGQEKQSIRVFSNSSTVILDFPKIYKLKL